MRSAHDSSSVTWLDSVFTASSSGSTKSGHRQVDYGAPAAFSVAFPAMNGEHGDDDNGWDKSHNDYGDRTGADEGAAGCWAYGWWHVDGWVCPFDWEG